MLGHCFGFRPSPTDVQLNPVSGTNHGWSRIVIDAVEDPPPNKVLSLASRFLMTQSSSCATWCGPSAMESNSLDQPVPSVASQRDYLSPAQFSERTGLSPATVRRYIAAGRIPIFQPGGFRSRVLIPHEALEVPPVTLESSNSVGSDPRVGDSKHLPNQLARLSGSLPRWKSKS